MQDNVYLQRVFALLARLMSLAGFIYILAAIAVFFMPGAYRTYAFDIQQFGASLMPFALRGRFVYALPFGGGLRGDFILYGIALKLLGKLLRKSVR